MPVGQGWSLVLYSTVSPSAPGIVSRSPSCLWGDNRWDDLSRFVISQRGYSWSTVLRDLWWRGLVPLLLLLNVFIFSEVKMNLNLTTPPKPSRGCHWEQDGEEIWKMPNHKRATAKEDASGKFPAVISKNAQNLFSFRCSNCIATPSTWDSFADSDSDRQSQFLIYSLRLRGERNSASCTKRFWRNNNPEADAGGGERAQIPLRLHPKHLFQSKSPTFLP